jgi:hypothetical protein
MYSRLGSHTGSLRPAALQVSFGLPLPLVKPLVNMPLHTASGILARAQHGAAYSLPPIQHPDNMGKSS